MRPELTPYDIKRFTILKIIKVEGVIHAKQLKEALKEEGIVIPTKKLKGLTFNLKERGLIKIVNSNCKITENGISELARLLKEDAPVVPDEQFEHMKFESDTNDSVPPSDPDKLYEWQLEQAWRQHQESGRAEK